MRSGETTGLGLRSGCGISPGRGVCAKGGWVTFLQIFILAVLQGGTEFLPISSSGHLVLVPVITGWPDQGLAMDVAVHVGTLGAVVVYLWRDMWAMLCGFFGLFRGRIDAGAWLILYLAVATIPVAIFGYLVKKYAGDSLRNIELIGWSVLVFGVALYAADKIGPTIMRIEHMTLAAAFIIGMVQVVALIPGSSRSGVTITAARALGYERREAARFSMLLSIPTIIAAGVLTSFDLVETQLRADAVLGAALAFIAALISITLMMRWLQTASYTPFFVYRVVLGLAILGWVYI
jgi:undecaprenyl-diphosphatase